MRLLPIEIYLLELNLVLKETLNSRKWTTALLPFGSEPTFIYVPFYYTTKWFTVDGWTQDNKLSVRMEFRCERVCLNFVWAERLGTDVEFELGVGMGQLASGKRKKMRECWIRSPSMEGTNWKNQLIYSRALKIERKQVISIHNFVAVTVE